MKPVTVTKLDKENKTTSKKSSITSCYRITTSWSFLKFITNLEQSKNRILHAWSIIFKFSLITIFYLTKAENRTKIYYTQLLRYWLWVKVVFLPKNADILQKNMLTLARLKRWRYYKVGFLKLKMWVYLRTKLQVFSKIVASFTHRSKAG